jgi:hypothetical protein
MYTKEHIKKLIPNSEHALDNLHQKYNDIKWLHYFYIDDDHDDLYIAISNKGDILYNRHYIGILLPEQATLIERRKNYDDIELQDDDIYFVNIKKNIKIIAEVIDTKLTQKYKDYIDLII